MSIESFETQSKQESIQEVETDTKKNLLELKDDIIGEENITKDFVISENINYEAIKNLQEEHPNLASILGELREKNKLKYDENTGEMKFDINFVYSNGGSGDPDINNYNILITKQGLQIKGKPEKGKEVSGKLYIPGPLNDELYDTPQTLDKLINTIKNRIIKEEGGLSDQQKESLDKTMNNAKIVFKSLFLEKIK